jgi:hypothetical protein
MPNSARNTDILSVVKQKTLSKSQKSSIPRGVKLNHNKKASFDLLHSPARSFETFDNRKVFKSPVINGFNGLSSINESLAERLGPLQQQQTQPTSNNNELFSQHRYSL